MLSRLRGRDYRVKEKAVRESGPAIFEIRLKKALTRKEYAAFVSEVGALLNQHGKVRLVLDVSGFEGWASGGFPGDITLEIGPEDHIDRLAVVGDPEERKRAIALCRPFTTGAARPFDRNEKEEAAEWLGGGPGRKGS